MQDGQGSTRALANASGVLTDAYSYTAFGTIYNQSGSTLNSYLYTGQQFDSLTGLYSLRARYYDPNVGRFLSQDTYPVDYQYPIELNRYGYSANSPINLSDPSGLQTTLEHTFAHGPLAENQSNVWKYVVGVAALFCFIIFMISLYTEQYIPFCGVYPLLKEVGDLLTKSKPDLSIWEEFMNGGMKWPKLPGEGTCLQYIAICVALGWHLYDAATNNNPQGNDTEEQTQPQPETGTGTQYKPGPGRCSIPQGTRSGAAGTVIGAKLQRVFHREVGWDFTTSESPLIPYPNGSHGEPDFVIYYNDNGEKTRQRPAALAEIYDIKPITYWEQDRLLGDVMFQLLKYINYFPKSYAKLAVGGKKFDPNGWVFRSPYYRRDEVLVLRTYYSSVEGVIFYECLQGQNLPRPTHDW